ncbi:MAG: S8 family peptidase [Parcubacteria group bacterium]|nr:S8 family peptidase [Parcubacteria group bacterium]
MPKKFKIFLALTAMFTLILSGTALVSKAESENEPAKRKIVVFKTEVDEITKQALINKAGAEKIKDLRLIRGQAVKLTAQAEKALDKEDGVLRIDDDIQVSALAKDETGASAESRGVKNGRNKPKPQPVKSMPWGIDRIDAELVWPSGNTADPIKVGIIDTGIDTAHPDLQANLKGGVSTVSYTASYNDDNGHGTHVAGITAALDNTIGVIGAGPNIDLYAIKVLDRNGSGWLSDIIEGLDWAIANHLQVVNMSLGASSDVQSFHDAVIRANAAGIVEVVAAGNSGGAVIYPAAYPEVIAVSATDSANTIASWSSRGPEVDLAAPGVSIYSTYKGSTYATLSGTSMAAPHVTGSAALVLNTPVGAYDVDFDSVWDPAEVQQKLQDRATDLGASGFDNLYGYGLVNAFNAVQP